MVVLVSFRAPHRETNPYLVQLVRALPGTVTTVHFSWRRALLEPYDVFHMHWPEVRLRGSTPARSVWRGLLFLLLLVRIRVQRIALVRTVHNAVPHEDVTWLQAALLRLCDRWTTLSITMWEQEEPAPGVDRMVIPHGHYRDWFEAFDQPDPVPGRVLHFGLVRRYKGVESLLRAFGHLDDPGLTLRIVGKQVDPGLAAHIGEAAARDRRVTVVDRYVPDSELAREVGESELVVLPFSEMTNSGSLLLALSLERPVLVPRGPASEALSAEVGPGWVLTYEGELSAGRLARALEELRSSTKGDPPDLSGREWASIGAAHALAYREARAALARRRNG